MIALYQNGERIMPGNGYPMRLVPPGYEGNMNMKWLRRIKLDRPAGDDLLRDADLLADPAERQGLRFFFLEEVKSFITHPSVGNGLKGPGYYEISGVAYSGTGRIAKVMVSADGGKSWAQAALQDPVQSKAFTRFRAPWRWDGGPAVLQSRAWDESGNVQPTRAEIVAERGETKGIPTSAAFQPALQRPDDLGGRGHRTGEACLRIRSVLAAALLFAAGGAQRESPRPRPAGQRSRPQGLGHHHARRRHRPAAGQRHRRARRQDLCRESAPPATAKAAKAARNGALVGSPPIDRIEAPKTIANFWGSATTIFDLCAGRCPTAAADADERRGLCADGLHPGAEQDHRHNDVIDARPCRR